MNINLNNEFSNNIQRFKEEIQNLKLNKQKNEKTIALLQAFTNDINDIREIQKKNREDKKINEEKNNDDEMIDKNYNKLQAIKDHE